MTIYRNKSQKITAPKRFDDLGDYLKTLEKNNEQKLLYNIPLVVRLDGKSFHTYTKYLKKPYEPWLSELMQKTTAFLVKETGAAIGYTQSDEITLIFKYANEDNNFSDLYGYRKSKIESILAGMTSAFFAVNAAKHKSDMIPYFDCRAFNVPSEKDACSVLIWRQEDATRNSMSMLAQTVYSHNELLGKSWQDKHEMLYQKEINWNNYPTFFKSGSFWKRVKYEILPNDISNISDIPEMYKPTEPIVRTKIIEIEMPRLRKIKNLEEVIFRNGKIDE